MQQELANLRGKTALVTGAAQRIGAEIARTLHGAGMGVVLHYRSSAGAARALAAELNGQRADSAMALAADLLEPDAPRALVDATAARWGGLDLLVNNASSFYPTPLEEITAAQWDDLLGTNVRAPLFLAQAAAAYLREAGGAIVNIADIHAERPLPQYSAYCAAKAGLVAITRSLARELGPHIRVNAVAPGVILWPAQNPPAQAARRAIVEALPLRRSGEPADIARTVLFLAGAAPYVTGQVVNVDGGRSLL